jgi:hypothetical protein
MAILSGNVIGNLSGKLGNLAARTVYGQTIMSARPSSFNVSYSDAVVEVRQKFAVTGSFSKAVLDSQYLKSIWDKVRIQGISTFNTIFKSNYSFSSSLHPTISNIITPDGFTSPVASCSIVDQKLNVALNPLISVNTFSAEELNISLSALVVLHTPNSVDDPEFRIFNLEKDVELFNFQSAYTAELPLSTFQTSLMSNYTNVIYFVTCITRTVANKIVQHSATYSIQT